MAELNLKAQGNKDGSITIRVVEAEVMKEVGVRAERTPAQELRLALMKRHERCKIEGEFEDWYKEQIQRFIEAVNK